MHLIGQIFDSGIGFCPEVSAHLKRADRNNIIQLTKSSRMGVKKSSGVPCSYNVGFSVYPGLIPIGIPMLQCAGEELKELRKKAY